MMGRLKGYKTYVVAGVAIIGAVSAYLVGDASLADTAKICIDALLATTLRHGIANS